MITKVLCGRTCIRNTDAVVRGTTASARVRRRKERESIHAEDGVLVGNGVCCRTPGTGEICLADWAVILGTVPPNWLLAQDSQLHVRHRHQAKRSRAD